MKRFRKILLWSVAGIALVVLVLIAVAYVLSERKLRAVYQPPASALTITPADYSVARGAHLVRAVGSCTLCHGDDLGGGVYADMGLVGVVAGPNLTRGRGGRPADFTLADWVRALRFGVRRDGTSLIMMPSEVFTSFSDDDLASIIEYIRQVPPVDRDVPTTHFGIVGRALLATGKLEILTAPKTKHVGEASKIPAVLSAEYGKYLAEVSGCHGCHGHGLSGGRVAGPPGLPPASNLTPEGIGSWSEADFRRAMRDGKKPDGADVNDFMPWKIFRSMTDDELGAIWLYLKSVPPKPFGNK